MSNRYREYQAICRSRSASVVILLLVVLLLVGLLTHQTVRSLWILRQGQDRQQRIAQANEVLQLGQQLDRVQLRAESDSMDAYRAVIPIGQEFASLKLVGSGTEARWVVTLPVDADGNKMNDTTAVEVSRERVLK